MRQSRLLGTCDDSTMQHSGSEAGRQGFVTLIAKEKGNSTFPQAGVQVVVHICPCAGSNNTGKRMEPRNGLTRGYWRARDGPLSVSARQAGLPWYHWTSST